MYNLAAAAPQKEETTTRRKKLVPNKPEGGNPRAAPMAPEKIPIIQTSKRDKESTASNYFFRVHRDKKGGYEL